MAEVADPVVDRARGDVGGDAVSAVRLSGVTKRFGVVAAVDDVTWTSPTASSSRCSARRARGKTTCLRMIAGFETPTAGTILLHGEDVNRLAPYERDVNTVFQDYALFPHMTVADNVGYGLMVREGRPRPRRRRRVDEAARRWSTSAASGIASRPQLSGGQRQRVALARALVERPACCCSTSPSGPSTSSCARPCRSS